MHKAGINLGNRILIYNYLHPTDAGQYELCVILGTVPVKQLVDNVFRHGRELSYWRTPDWYLHASSSLILK